jgi:hypothetical protein
MSEESEPSVDPDTPPATPREVQPNVDPERPLDPPEEPERVDPDHPLDPPGGPEIPTTSHVAPSRPETLPPPHSLSAACQTLQRPATNSL